MPIQTLTVPADSEDARLDRFLASSLALSRSQLQRLIKDGCVLVAGRTAKANQAVKPGQEISIDVPELIEAAPLPEALPLPIVYQDKDLIVVDKPAGMVVHPAPGNPEGTLVNALLAHCGPSLAGIGGVRRPGIVHRLDKDTSGLLVAAKTEAAHRALSQDFALRRIERAYCAIVWEIPSPATGEIVAWDLALLQSLAHEFELGGEASPVSEGELARQALLVLAEDPETRNAIETMATSSTSAEKFDFGATPIRSVLRDYGDGLGIVNAIDQRVGRESSKHN